MLNLIKKAISFYKQNVHIQSLMGNGLMAFIGMGSTALLYRGLPVVELGIYLFVLAVNSFMDTLRGGFLTITLIKFYSGETKERAAQVAGSSWVLGIAVTAAAVLINIPTYFFASYFTDPNIVISLKYFSIIPIVTLPSFMANCILQAHRRFDLLFILRLINQGSFVIAIIGLMVFNQATLFTVLMAFVATNLFASICSLVFNWTEIGSIKYANNATTKELYHFGKYAMGTNVTNSLFGFTYTFVITFLIGPAGLAMYNLGGKLLQIVEIPLLSFAASGMPILSASYNNGKKEEMMDTLKKLIGMLTIVLIPIVLLSIIFAEPIINLVGGGNYANTAAPNIFRIFMLLSLMSPADRYFALSLDVIHQPKVNFYKIWVMLAVNFIAIFIGISIYNSIYSIMFALFFPNLAAILMTYYPLNKYSKFNFWSMYVIGYNEVILYVAQLRKSIFSK
jgi:O-antigen/teichoic acid export membrane protein